MSGKIPAFINTAAGSADAAREALAGHDKFDVREVPPGELGNAIRSAIEEGAPRVLVAGGDGTIATAGAHLIEGETQLAILPGGTLNHFARDLGISTVAVEALELAHKGTHRGVDVGMVNDRIFLNTSSVGAYVHFVKMREYLEEQFGYGLASAIAAFRILFQLDSIGVELEVDGKRRIYRTPLVFIGVGERELQLPALGHRVPNGKRGLHVFVVKGRTRARVLALALSAVARGVKTSARTPQLDSFIVNRCTIIVKGRDAVAVDGELVQLDSPLEYQIRHDALSVVCP
jgi:diacylglycerol kinase family enzyme